MENKEIKVFCAAFFKKAAGVRGTSATADGVGSKEREEWQRSKIARISANAPTAIFGHRNRIGALSIP